jgi:RNA polymerase sigma-70 factor (ECF subfamily)
MELLHRTRRLQRGHRAEAQPVGAAGHLLLDGVVHGLPVARRHRRVLVEELLDDGRPEPDLQRALVDQVEYGAVAGDLRLGAVARRGRLRDRRLDALARRHDVLDGVRCFSALDPGDVDQRLEHLWALPPERVRSSARGIDGAKGPRDGCRHEAGLPVEDAKRMPEGLIDAVNGTMIESHCAVYPGRWAFGFAIIVIKMARPDDQDLVAGLRAGDEAAIATLVDRHSDALLRVAMGYVPSRAVAEEVVQETWIAVMRGIDGFEGRSSLKTWIFRILTNTALRGGTRERRSVPFAALAAAEDTGAPSVDPDRFLPADHELFPGHWVMMPARWPTPEEGLLSGETRAVIVAAIEALPKAQRTVLVLRDVEGWSSEEACEALEISAGNQRILLHRARTRVRAAIEDYFGAVRETAGRGST